MKSKYSLFASIFQLVIGLLAIAAFFIAVASGESFVKWIITLILAVIYVVLGIIGIIDHKSKN